LGMQLASYYSLVLDAERRAIGEVFTSRSSRFLIASKQPGMSAKHRH
jgi:hypothetical protein